MVPGLQLLLSFCFPLANSMLGSSDHKCLARAIKMLLLPAQHGLDRLEPSQRGSVNASIGSDMARNC